MQSVKERLTQAWTAWLNPINLVAPVSFVILSVYALFLVNVPKLAYIGADDGFHIRNGQMWFNSFPNLIQHDSYSWLVPDRIITHTTWLYDIALYGLNQGYGSYGSVLAYSVLVAMWVSLLLFLFQKINGDLRLAIGFTTVILLVSVYTLNLSPQLVGNVFFAASLLLVEQYRRGELKYFGYKWTILLIAWANFHPDFPVSMAFLFGLIVEEAWKQRKVTKELWIAFVGGILGITAFSPDHFGTWLYPLQSLFESTNRYIQEWQPSVSSPVSGDLFLLLAIFCAIVMWKKERSFMRWLVWLAFLYLGYHHIRQLPYFLVVSGVYLASYLKDYVLPSTKPSHRTKNMLIVSIGMFLFFLMVSFAQIPTDALYQKVGYPVNALQYIEKNNLENYRWFTPYNQGAFIIGQDPKLQVFIDGRQDVYTGMMEHPKAFNWMEVDVGLEINGTLGTKDLQKWGVEYALVRNDTPIEKELEGIAKQIYKDKNYEIYKLKPTQTLTPKQIEMLIKKGET